MINDAGQHIQFIREHEEKDLPGVWDLDIPESYIFWHDQAFAIHGFPVQSPACFIINQARLLIHPEDVETLRQECEKPGTEMAVYTYFRILTPSGELKIIYLEAVPVQVEGKTVCQGKFIDEMVHIARIPAIASANLSHALLLSSEQFLHAGTWQINLHTHKTFYSTNLYRIYGVIPGSLKAHTDTFRKFIHPDEKRIVSDTFDRAMDERIPFHLEYRIITGQGEIRYVKQLSKVMRNELAETIMIGVTQDITETKINELALRESKESAELQNELYSTTEKLTESGYWQLNVRTRKLVYSDNFFRLHGLKPQHQILGREFFLNYVYADDRTQVTQAFRDAQDKQIPPQLSYQIYRADGKLRRLQLAGKILTNAEKEVVILGVVKDVTDEYQLGKSVDSVKNGNYLQQELFQYQEEITYTGSWRTDLETLETAFSPNFFRLWGLKINHPENTVAELVKFIHPDDAEAASRLFGSMFTEPASAPLECRIIGADGTMRDIRLENRLLKTEGKITHLMGVMMDVTQVKTIELEKHHLKAFSDLVGDTMREIYFITDLHHTIISYNKRFAEEYGFKDSDVRNRNLFDVLPPMKHPSVVENLERAMADEQVFLPNYRSCLNNQYLDVHMAPLKDPAGTVNGVLTIVQDITPETNLRDQLSRRLELNENLIENTIDRIIVLDENFNIIVWNKQCEVYFALAKNQVLHKNVLDIFPTFKKEPTYENLQQALKGEAVYIPGSELMKDGRYTEQYMIPLRDEKENVYAVLWLVHDFTKEHLLTGKQKKADTILDAMNEGCFELDSKKYCFRYLNRKAEEMLGFSSDVLTGKCIWDVFPHAQHTPLYTGVMHTCEHAAPYQEEYFSQFLNKWVLLKVSPTESGVIVLLLDLQEIKDAEARAQREQEYWRALVESTPDEISRWNRNLKLMYANPAFERNRKQPASVLLNKTKVEIGFPREGAAAFMKALREVIKTGKQKDFYNSLDMTDGLHYFYSRMVPESGENGEVESILSITRDHTELQLALHAVLENRYVTEQLADAVDEMMFVAEVNTGELVFTNSAWQRWTGRQEGGNNGPVALVSIVHPEDRALFTAHLEKIKTAGPHMIVESEYRVINASQQICWVKDRSGVIKRDAYGTAIEALGLWINITGIRGGTGG